MSERDDKRLAMLEQLTAGGQADSFAWYGLALEYRKRERWDDALATFRSLRDKDPGYVAQYLMAGQMLAALDRTEEAREWLEAGVKQATEAGNSHALGELRDALEGL